MRQKVLQSNRGVLGNQVTLLRVVRLRVILVACSRRGCGKRRHQDGGGRGQHYPRFTHGGGLLLNGRERRVGGGGGGWVWRRWLFARVVTFALEIATITHQADASKHDRFCVIVRPLS